MTVFVTHLTDSIAIQARAVGEGGMRGDLTMIIKPGEDALGKSYNEWSRLSTGKHDIDV